MQIDKQQIIQFLQQRGNNADAQEAQNSLPDQVDPQEHARLLQKFNINPSELLGQAGGSGDIAGKLGGMLGKKD